MTFRDLPGKRLPFFPAVLFLAVLGIGFLTTTAFGEESRTAAIPPSAAALWQAAEKAVAAGNKKKAAGFFDRLYRDHPEAKQAEEALWQEARLRQELALGRKDADWEQVRGLYHLYITEYPKGRHFEKAYLALGLVYYRMHFSDEALGYLELFLGRFPRSRFRDKALYWQGRTLAEMGRPGEAKRIYQELAAGNDHRFRVKAKEGLGDLSFAAGRFEDALAFYEEALKEFAPYTRDRFEVIRKLGLTQCRLGNEVACRDNLYQYLNVVPNSPHEVAVLFELGESLWRSGDTKAAQVLYQQVLAKTHPGDREAVLSRFRLALAKSREEKGLPTMQNPKGSGVAGDEPYQAVLEDYGQEPIAQDARYALLQRFMARGDSQGALLLAKTYLDSHGGKTGQREKVASILGGLLAARVKELLQAKKYQKVCDLYQEEYPYISTYKEGRLLYLVGQAFEALGLYDQASVVYYRALAGELTPKEKSDLYERRARVYLAMGDLGAAERLLAYLRDIYAGKKEIGEVFYLSGRLREAQGKTAKAASFYTKACNAAVAGKGGASCLAEVRLLLRLDQVKEAAAALADSRQRQLMSPQDLQQGYSELGEAWQHQGHPRRAVAAYTAAIGKKMPQKGQKAQAAHLRLADLYLKLGRMNDGVSNYQKASSGPDPLLAKSAEEGLQMIGIQQEAGKLRFLAPPPESVSVRPRARSAKATGRL